VVGILQSVASRDYQDVDVFGLVVVDECHHVAAPTFNAALQKFHARCVLGLSATPHRKDGLTKVLRWSLGSTLFKAERTGGDLSVLAIEFEGGNQVVRKARGGKPLRPIMLTHLSCDMPRNALISREILACYLLNRNVIVLSDRCAQLVVLRGFLLEFGVPESAVCFYTGETPKHKRLEAEQAPVILSTYPMAREGLDIPRLDTLVLATPTSDAEQAVGRVQRGARAPLVVDFVDMFSDFVPMWESRLRLYRKKRFDVTHACTMYRGTHSKPVTLEHVGTLALQ
jgi:superfamily II DNA or RNA helicase